MLLARGQCIFKGLKLRSEVHLVCCRFMSSNGYETAQQCRYIYSTWEWFPILQQYYIDKQEIKILKCTTHSYNSLHKYILKKKHQINTIIHTKILSQCCSFLIDYVHGTLLQRENRTTDMHTHACMARQSYEGTQLYNTNNCKGKNLDLLQ